jgi:hypothetical protein
MYGRIGDIWRGYGKRRKADGVNNRGGWVRREINWLPILKLPRKRCLRTVRHHA